MRNEFTAIIERDGAWYLAYCAEAPGANGQGKTEEECLANLHAAIALVLEHRREESLRSGNVFCGICVLRRQGRNRLARRICRKLSIPNPPG